MWDVELIESSLAVQASVGDRVNMTSNLGADGGLDL